MPEKDNIFDDPRSPRQRSEANREQDSAQPIEPLPEAEEDWYLKRKPVVSHVGIVKENNSDG